MDPIRLKNLAFAPAGELEIFHGSMHVTQFLEKLFTSMPNVRLWSFTGMKNREQLWVWDIIQQYLTKTKLYHFSSMLLEVGNIR